MKNKFKKLLISSLVLLGLSGCVKFNTTMDIKKDKSMDYSVIYGMTSTLVDNQQILSDEEKKELETKGFKAEDYKDDKYTGIKLTISFDNIDDVSTDNDTEFSLSKIADKSEKLENIFKVKKGILKNTYTANFKFDQSDSGMSDTDFDTDIDDDTPYDVQSSPATSIGSSKYDVFKTDVENIYKQALTKFTSDSLNTPASKTYCNINACTTPNETGVSTTSNYIVKLDKTGKITYICVWNDSYIYEKKGTDIKITDINSETMKVNSNVKITKYTVASTTAKEVPFTFTPTYQSLQAVEQEETDNSIFEDSMMEAMMSSMDLKYVINLPYKAISSNATQKTNDDKTLTWDLTTLKENENIKFEFYIYNMTNILIGAGIIVILIVIILLIVKSKKSKKDKTQPINNVESNNETNNTQSQPQNTEVVSNEAVVSNEVNDSINSVVGLTEQASQPETVSPVAPIVETQITNTPVPEVVAPETPTIDTPTVESVIEPNVATPDPAVEPVAPVVETPVVPETIPTVETPITEPIIETTPIVENVVSTEPTPMVEQAPVEQVIAETPVPVANVVEPVAPTPEVAPVSPEVQVEPIASTETSVQTEQQNIIQ